MKNPSWTPQQNTFSRNMDRMLVNPSPRIVKRLVNSLCKAIKAGVTLGKGRECGPVNAHIRNKTYRVMAKVAADRLSKNKGV